jgi:pimeloyl-ACP methyl ester carboxylesterase
MSARPTEILFMPGFDGVGELRREFVEALAAIAPASAIAYPNRMLESLNGYARFASSQVSAESRPVLVAESFSGLVAARWAAHDPHVAALVLCGAFASNPNSLSELAASWPGTAKFFGANIMNPMAFFTTDPVRKRWSHALKAAVGSLDKKVIAERLRIIATDDVGAQLRGLRIPIVIAHFQDDVVIDPQSRSVLESFCHDPQVINVAGPHVAIETRPRETAAALKPHLAALFA